jgi:GNAT superfamily N-acetyltransferase
LAGDPEARLYSGGLTLGIEVSGTRIIRSAAPGDAPTLAQLRYQFRTELDPPTEPAPAFLERCTAWMAQRLASGSHWRCWIAAEGDAILATAWLQIIEKLPNPGGELERHGYISSVFVRPECRGHGIGSDLLKECLRMCDAEEVDAVFLWPTARSRALYRRLGFETGGDVLLRRRTL